MRHGVDKYSFSNGKSYNLNWYNDRVIIYDKETDTYKLVSFDNEESN